MPRSINRMDGIDGMRRQPLKGGGAIGARKTKSNLTKGLMNALLNKFALPLLRKLRAGASYGDGTDDDIWIRYDLRAKEWVTRDKVGFDVPMPELGEGTWMTMYAPAGFRFDLGSIPRVFWPAIAPHEISVRGALAHDWLYGNGAMVGVCRKTADLLLRDMMVEAGVPKWRVSAVYRAVRMFGWASYKKRV